MSYEILHEIHSLLCQAEKALVQNLPEVALEKFELAESLNGGKFKKERGRRVYRKIQFAFAKGQARKFCGSLRCALVELRNTALYIYYGLKRR